MFDFILGRFIRGFLVLFLGIHLIGSGILFSGADVPGNIVWPPIAALFSFELSFLRGLFTVLTYTFYALVFAALVYGVILIVGMIGEVKRKAQDAKFSNCRSESTEKNEFDAPNVQKSFEKYPITKEVTVANQYPTSPTPWPKPPEPSPEELKERAIEQIMRGY